MIPAKTRPAITTTGDKGAAEGLGLTSCVIVAEIVAVTVTFPRELNQGRE